MLAENGVKIVAPPMWMLVKEDPNSDICITTSAYVDSAKEHGLGIIEQIHQKVKMAQQSGRKFEKDW